ncbi:DUF423 domain-containing protein [uncultured Porticoccus sp.]|uniref:DUF423 domain-containing protein n=1 Tax=uncultured Porticoccus sp. TaxID=1256050 RepID=UPI0030DB2365
MKLLAVFAAMSGFLAVALGAFGAHGLRGSVSSEMLVVWQTAVLYQMFHALALLALVVAAMRQPLRLLDVAGWLMVAGTLLFSGSLYALVITGFTALGMVTPFGGLLFMASWVVLSFALVRLVAMARDSGV